MDRMRAELEAKQATRAALREDLTKCKDLSAAAQRVIRIELFCLDADIVSLRKEIEDMDFQELMHNAWNGDRDE